jgi:DNA-binding NarL/FixJ family response regulator
MLASTFSSAISVLVVDDHPIMRMGITSIVESGEMRVVGQAGSGEDAVRMHRQLRPDVTLMDLHLPTLSGVDAIRQIRGDTPDARIVVLTIYAGDEDIHQALHAGASGYLIKGMSHDTLLMAVRQVHRGSRYLPRTVAQALQSRDPSSYLSQREREVLQLMFQGMSNREIADALQIKEVTVKSHVSVILMRLRVSDRTQAVVEGLKRGLLHL